MSMPESKVDLLIVRGAPGVGKSTAVRRLRKHIPDGAVIEVDSLRGMIAAVQWVNTEQHWVALDQASLLIKGFLAKGFRPVVLVDTFSRGKLTRFVQELDNSYLVASLFASEDELVCRVSKRPDDDYKDIDACLRLNSEVAENRYENEHLIDTSTLRPTAVAEVLKELLW